MLIDELQPDWHHRERHALRVSAPADAVLTAVHQLTWGEVPLFRVLMSVRALGRRPQAADRTILAGMRSLGFAELARKDDELVYGGIGRPWSPSGGPIPLPEEPARYYAAFDRPGYACMILNFRCADGVLSTETRVRLTDAAARRAFLAYWPAMRPFSGAIRRAWLAGIRRRAERYSCG